MEKRLPINLDLKRKSIQMITGLKQGDNNDVLYIKLLQDSLAYDLTGLTVRLNLKRPDQAPYFQAVGTGVEILDILQGSVKVSILSEILDIPGEVQADVSIFEGENKVSSGTFKMVVEESVFSEGALPNRQGGDLIQNLIITEQERIDSETARLAAETVRGTNETTRIANEDTRIADEDTRELNEGVRITKENERLANEVIRESNEDARVEEFGNMSTTFAQTIQYEVFDAQEVLIDKKINNDVEAISAQLNDKAKQSDLQTEINNRINAVSTEKSERQAEISVERSRITNLATLSAGSTTGDAELIDARLGADGITYANAGTAIRGQINNLKSDLGKWAYSVTAYNDWQRIDVVGEWSSGDKVYIKPLSTDSTISYVRLNGILNSVLTTDVASLTCGDDAIITLPSNFDTLRVEYKLSTVTQGITYSAIVKKIYEDGSALGNIANIYAKLNEDEKNITELSNVIDSPFLITVPNALKGIVAFSFIANNSYPINDNQQYRVTRVDYKSNGFYMYLPIQCYKNGSWVGYDAIEILLANSPTETAVTILTSKYGRFKCAIIPSQLGVGTLSGLTYSIKFSAVPYFVDEQQIEIDNLTQTLTYGDYGFKDYPRHIINVDINGSGDYTSIANAYASITDSSFDNQYEIRVFPGVYNEINLIPPKYTHTHGLRSNTVTVSSVGIEGSTEPVFDLMHTAKLSNMTIISAYGYCVHLDSGDGGRFTICENLYCKKVYDAILANPLGVDVQNYAWRSYTNPSVLGMGMGGGSYKFVFNNCTFENGEVASHTNANNDTYPNTHIIYDNCKCVNAYLYFMTAGNGEYNTNGKYVCKICGMKTQVGKKTLKITYTESDSPWLIIGGENYNFTPEFNNTNGVTEAWANINTNDKSYIQLASGVSVTKGQWVDCNGSICNGSTSAYEISGIALESKTADAKQSVAIWTGNAYPYTASNGEYGINSDGNLSASASVKIGRVINNIFYRYN